MTIIWIIAARFSGKVCLLKERLNRWHAEQERRTFRESDASVKKRRRN